LQADDELHSDLRTYSSLMHALAASEKWSQTRTVEMRLRTAGLRPDSTLALQLMSGYARCGWPAAAEAVMDEMMDEYSSKRPNRSHWNALLYAYATARQYNGCLMAYERMVSKVGIRPDSYSMVALLKAAKRSQAGRNAVFFSLNEIKKYNIPFTVELAASAIACCRTMPYISQQEAEKSRDMANQVWDSLLQSDIKPNRVVYNTLLAARADAGDVEGVRQLFEVLENDNNVYPDEATFRILLRTYKSQGNWRELEQH